DQVRFTTAPLPPVPAPSDGSELTGSGEAGSIITVTTEDGEPVGETTVNPDGTWTLQPDSPLDVGTIVIITQTDDHGRDSERVPWRIGQPTILVDRPEVAHGDTQTARAINFQPGETIRGTVPSAALDLPTVEANVNGGAIFTFAIPASFDPGEHRVDATGSLSGAAEPDTFIVTEPAPAPTTPAATTPSATPTVTVTTTTTATPPVSVHTVTPPVPVQTIVTPLPTTQAPRSTPTIVVTTKPGVHPPTGMPAGTIPLAGTALGIALTGLLLLLATRRRRDQQE
ncbi:MAG: Ig-like domain-containing protein, partial [Bifidobacteriaceae bacterium]|nr:Ig-like domain-containing protein [Bifidobacteriaceae bacterium]